MLIFSSSMQFLYAEATISTVQSTARPFGLDIIDDVYLAGSDDKSVDFQVNYLPEINEIIQTSLGERMSLDNDTLDSIALDPDKLI